MVTTVQKSRDAIGFKETEVGVIPDDWNVLPLGSLAHIQRGALPRPIDSPRWYDQGSGVGWIRISDIANADGRYLTATRDYLSQQGISQDGVQ
jgi:type I restriction enzyme, S subunit